MQIDLYQLLQTTPALVFFLVLGFGYLLGRIGVKGVRLGPTAGVLLAGLVFGHFGLTGPRGVNDIGFILFMYSVGFQAGPRFFSVFLEDGLKYICLSLLVALCATGTALGYAKLVGFSNGLSAGLLAGSLSSTPTLAAAQDAVASGLVQVSGTESLANISNDISIGYALTYIISLVGITLMVRAIPVIFKFDLKTECQKLSEEKRLKDDSEDDSIEEYQQLRIRAFQVSNPDILGKTLEDLDLRRSTGCVVQEIKRGNEIIQPDAHTQLQDNDRISVAGSIENLEKLTTLIGPGIFDRELLRASIQSATVVISSAETAGKRIGELHTLARYGCFITKIVRAQIELPVNSDIVLEKGDVIKVTGLKNRLDSLIKRFGHAERDIVKTDLLTFAFGIAAGVLLGKITIKVGALTLGLGMSGGLLVAGILVGFLRSVHPTFGRVPPAARWIIMELGLLFFMASIGLNAGNDIFEALSRVGGWMLLGALLVGMVPMGVGFLFGRHVLHFNYAQLLGAMTGAMTNTPALNVVTQQAGSSLPALGYAGAYTFANIFLALCGSMIMML